MILYTPLSESDIFPTESQDFQKYEMVNLQGKMVQVERLENGTCRIVQLLSTDPQDFLNEQFMPGSMVSSHEIIG
ncbi:YlzJ-like family protein [Aquibacillus koreensis]|uniref:YlzJ-like family protein n=1 Tax=Aquibacillus koreensis TaxID=279446 RepID=A0A9X4AKV5_9BACI|nr:YlzJ-like family protein [Aquibacillus koreensis]MCT2534581.1 YlzJ-like family protein [Aquibacillus koreensis]MDC3421825.1 YlzJ-like family protein [Aquibacillus koreensis]